MKNKYGANVINLSIKYKEKLTTKALRTLSYTKVFLNYSIIIQKGK